MGERFLATPPIAFAIVLAVVFGLSLLLSRLTFRRKQHPAGQTKPYACGEETPNTMVQPDLAQFFPFACFFTILHVVALMATTVPAETMTAFVIALVYLASAVVGLLVLYRKW
jgi:NADH:ubiquinone oxidoreductase subunit 3 (subunit A)